MTTQWYVAIDGQTSGPHSWDELVALGASGRIGADDPVWSAGDATSLLARHVPGLLPVEALPPPAVDDLVVESTAWHVTGRGDPQAPLKRLLNPMGTLRLAAGRLTFTAQSGRVRLDAPVAELHSLARAESGAALEVWHGDVRHRILFGGSSELAVPSAPAFGGVIGAIETVQGVSAARAQLRGAQAIVDGWLELLEPRAAASAPAGVKVRPPRTGAAYGAMVALKFLVLVVLVGLVTVVPIVVLAG